ncbi:MAG: hypothetical protein LZF61_08850 [Nitrosomonas sp.]|nr:MAG: hypothetical protein LZF61_08850 [Nitrosomonas sp.]
MKTNTIFFISALVIVLTFTGIASMFGLEVLESTIKEFLVTEIGTGVVLFTVYLWLSHNHNFFKKQSKILRMSRNVNTEVVEKGSEERRVA